METQKKSRYKHNPVSFINEKTEALDEAYRLFMEAFTEYAAQKKLTEKELESLKEEIYSTYRQQLATYFIENKLIKISNFLDKSITYALNKPLSEEGRDNVTKFYYYNNKHHLISHEQ